jgi:hypothetical protein
MNGVFFKIDSTLHKLHFKPFTLTQSVETKHRESKFKNVQNHINAHRPSIVCTVHLKVPNHNPRKEHGPRGTADVPNFRFIIRLNGKTVKIGK